MLPALPVPQESWVFTLPSMLPAGRVHPSVLDQQRQRGVRGAARNGARNELRKFALRR